MNRFYAPYNFIPATGTVNDKPTPLCAVADWPAQAKAARHDVWQEGCYSGNFLCRVTTESPMGVGAEQKPRGGKDRAALRQVTLYQRNGLPAIPASSLRGVVGSVLEAMSQSALRVLDKRDDMTRSEGLHTPKIPVRGSVFASLTSIAPHLVPFDSARSGLTPAECLLGVVSEDVRTQFQALTSRLQFNDALCVTAGHCYPDEILQIMASPHAKSPAFYYNQKHGRAAAKMRFQLDPNDPDAVFPNGRKVYLHQSKQFLREHWKEHPLAATKNDKQRTRVSLVREGEVFAFQLQFSNLSGAELRLLIESLQPSTFYRHRVGLGKPLGLGRINLEIVGLEVEDRSQHYQQNAKEIERFRLNEIPLTTQASERFKHVLARLPASMNLNLDQLKAMFADTSLIDETSRKRMLLIGNPAGVDASDVPTVYPRTPNQLAQWRDRSLAQANEGLFNWFTQNGNPNAVPNHQLKPIKVGSFLPSFPSNPHDPIE